MPIVSGSLFTCLQNGEAGLGTEAGDLLEIEVKLQNLKSSQQVNSSNSDRLGNLKHTTYIITAQDKCFSSV